MLTSNGILLLIAFFLEILRIFTFILDIFFYFTVKAFCAGLSMIKHQILYIIVSVEEIKIRF